MDIQRFSIRQLLLATAIVALFCVAFVTENPWWRATLGTLTMGMLLNALVAAIFARGEQRAYSLSFFLGAVFFFFGFYTYMVSLPYMITIKFYDYLSNSLPVQPDEENFMLVAIIFWLQVLCLTTAQLGLAWYRRSQKTAACDKVYSPSASESDSRLIQTNSQ
ncbi:MAG: hypothetical protein KDB03_24145 [Planctomycetales bacterium]|nr:hypothetical protein [Planctomycetales bacterium]